MRKALLVPTLLANRAVFTPTSVAGLALWISAQSGLYQDTGGTTPAASDGDVVGRMNDQSGNARNATQATTASKPLLKLNIFGSQPGILFDGSDDSLQTASINHGIGTGDFHLFAAIKTPAVLAGYHALFSNGTYSPGFYLNGDVLDLYTTGDNVAASVLSINTKYLLEFVRESGTLKFFINGVQDANTADLSAYSIANAVWSVYQSGAGSEVLGGYLGDLLLYTSAVAASAASIRSYLNSRNGGIY